MASLVAPTGAADSWAGRLFFRPRESRPAAWARRRASSSTPRSCQRPRRMARRLPRDRQDYSRATIARTGRRPGRGVRRVGRGRLRRSFL